MINDFNPLDLSAPPKKIEEPITAPQPVQPKATVQRVSMGPIFHSRITRILALILGVALAALVGYAGTSYLLNRKENISTKQPAISAEQTSVTDQKTTGTSDTAAKKSGQDTPTTEPAETKESPVYCGVAGMPEQVCVAITSIEKSGLKNNPYVGANTSQVPADNKVEVDESSWQSTSTETGAVNFTAILAGKSYAGLAYLQIVSGTWKVTSYTLQ